MKKYKTYLAGPLFTRGEIRDRYNDEKRLLTELPQSLDIFNPINWNKTEQIDGGKIQSIDPVYIFKKDWNEIIQSDIMIVDLDNCDSGTILEMGHFITMKHLDPTKLLYVIYSNWKGLNTLNKYVLGAINSYGIICKDIEDVITKLKIYMLKHTK